MTSAPPVAVTATTEIIRDVLRTRANASYTDAARAAGLRPFILPVLPPGDADAMLDGMAGLILTGGEDVDPVHYGHAPHPALGEVHAARDSFELALVRAARTRRLPTLAICRGVQVVNVALGGTLFQHVPDLTEIEHRQNTTEIPPQTGIHAVELVPGSIVAGVYGTESLQTNSFHHQALKDVAAPFEVSGRSADGMIEAVEANDKGCFFAVQWHPEMMHAHDTLQLAPFTRLIEKSSSRRLAPTGD